MVQCSLTRRGRFYRKKLDGLVAGILLDAGNKDDEWWLSALKDVASPFLLIRGSGSAILSRATAQRMVSTVTRGVLREIQGAGHSVMTDNPKGFSTTLSHFLAQSEHNRIR